MAGGTSWRYGRPAITACVGAMAWAQGGGFEVATGTTQGLIEQKPPAT